MRKKRIAFVTNSLYGGGAERILQIVLRNFDRRLYDITVINHRSEEVNELYPDDITYRSILKSNSGKGKLLARIYNKISLLVYENFSPRLFRVLYLRDRFDVEIAFIEGYATRIVSGGRSDRKIAWVHIDLKVNPWADIAFRSKKEQAECYSLFDHVVSVSGSVKNSFDELFPGLKSSVIYNPIDSSGILTQSTRFIAKRNKKEMLFVSVGRLVEQKGYDRLIPIASKLSEEGFAFQLWIIGNGEDRESLESQIKELGLESTVELLGFRDNPYPYIAAADWFVCSSRSEGYSTVVTESLILSTPVIATRCAGMDELLGEDNRWGMIVDNDDRKLLDGMREILLRPELTDQYRTKAAERGGKFSLENQMKEIYMVIEE